MSSREDELLFEQLFRRKEKSIPAGFSTSAEGLMIPDGSRSAIEVVRRDLSTVDTRVNAAMRAVMGGYSTKNNLIGLQDDVEVTAIPSAPGLQAVVKKPLTKVFSGAQIESAADYDVADIQFALTTEKSEKLSWAEVVALQENPLQFLQTVCTKTAVETQNNSLENISAYFEYFKNLTRLLGISKEVTAEIQKMSADISLSADSIHIELLPALLTSFMEHHTFTAEKCDTFDVIRASLYDLSQFIINLSQLEQSNEAVVIKLSNLEQSIWEVFNKVWLFYRLTIYTNNQDNPLTKVSTETFEVAHKAWLAILSQPHVEPQALRVIELYISRFVRDYRQLSSKAAQVTSAAVIAENPAEFDTTLPNTAAIAEEYADLLCTGMFEGAKMEANRHVLYDILLQLDVKNIHWKTKEKLCKKMIAYGDQQHLLATILTIQLSEKGANSPLIVELDSQRENLLRDLSGSPDELLKNYDELLLGVSKLPIVSPLTQEMNQARAQIGYEVEFYYASQSARAMVPEGFVIKKDRGTVFEAKPSNDEVKNGYSNEHLGKVSNLALWYRDIADSSNAESALHIHLDRKKHPAENDLAFGGLFRGRYNDREGHLGPTTEVRNIPLPRNGANLDVRTISSLFELLGTKNKAAFSEPVSLPDFPNQKKANVFLEEINLNKLFFAHICAISPDPQTRLAALSLSADTDLVRSLMTPTQFHFLAFTFSHDFISALNPQNFPQEYSEVVVNLKILCNQQEKNPENAGLSRFDELGKSYEEIFDQRYQDSLFSMLSYLGGEKLQLLIEVFSQKRDRLSLFDGLVNNPDPYAIDIFTSTLDEIVNSNSIRIQQARTQTTLIRVIEKSNTDYFQLILAHIENPNFPENVLPAIVAKTLESTAENKLDFVWKVMHKQTEQLSYDSVGLFEQILKVLAAELQKTGTEDAIIEFINSQQPQVKNFALPCLGEVASNAIISYLLSFCIIPDDTMSDSSVVFSALIGLKRAIESGKTVDRGKEISAVSRKLLFSCNADNTLQYDSEVYVKAFEVYTAIEGLNALDEVAQFAVGVHQQMSEVVQHVLKAKSIYALYEIMKNREDLLAETINYEPLTLDANTATKITYKKLLLQATTTDLIDSKLKNDIIKLLSINEEDIDLLNTIRILLQNESIPAATVIVIGDLLYNQEYLPAQTEILVEKSQLFDMVVAFLNDKREGDQPADRAEVRFHAIELINVYWLQKNDNNGITEEQKKALFATLMKKVSVNPSYFEANNVVFEFAPKLYSKEENIELFFAYINAIDLNDEFLVKTVDYFKLNGQEQEAFFCRLFEQEHKLYKEKVLIQYCVAHFDEETQNRIFWHALHTAPSKSFDLFLLTEMFERLRNRTEVEMNTLFVSLFKKVNGSRKQFVKYYIINQQLSMHWTHSPVECVKKVLRSKLNHEEVYYLLSCIFALENYLYQDEKKNVDTYEQMVEVVFQFILETKDVVTFELAIKAFQLDGEFESTEKNFLHQLFTFEMFQSEISDAQMLSEMSDDIWSYFIEKRIFSTFAWEDTRATESLNAYLLSRDHLVELRQISRMKDFMQFLLNASLHEVLERVCAEIIDSLPNNSWGVNSYTHFFEKFITKDGLSEELQKLLGSYIKTAKESEYYEHLNYYEHVM